MIDLNENDRKLIAALKKDSRASVTTLAGVLGLSRATVQMRLERLITGGVIRQFTVELAPEVEGSLVRAMATIEIQGSNAESIILALKQTLGIVAVHTTNGAWDLVAQIETFSLDELDQVLRQIRKIRGVLNSETSILLAAA
ncbi:MAG: Lrp/AsnC family transcriptional regulator [Pseudomonadota bacterium]